MLEHNIDYIQMTCNMDEKDFTKEEVKSIRGLPYYPIGYEALNGIRYYFGNNKGANCFVVLSGQECQYLRDCGNTDKDTLEWVFANGGKVSRLDLAITEFIETELFTVEDVKSWSKQGIVTSSLMGNGMVKGIFSTTSEGDTLETLYIGDIKKRGKKGIFRAYDKGLDLGIGKEVITRIELELKREKAMLAASRIVQTGDIAGNFRTYFDVKSDEFERIMQTPKQEAVRGKGKPKSKHETENDDRWKWLLEAVAPALKDAILKDNELGLSNARAMDFMNRAGLAGLSPTWIQARKPKRTPKTKYNTLDFD
jgi:DNA relaxase NicK